MNTDIERPDPSDFLSFYWFIQAAQVYRSGFEDFDPYNSSDWIQNYYMNNNPKWKVY